MNRQGTNDLQSTEQDLPSSIRELIDLRANETPDAVYLIDPESGEKTTYSTLREQVRIVAAAISAKAIAPGSSVAYAMGNSPQTAITILAIQYGGFLATAINLVAGSETIAYVIDHSDAQLIVTDAPGRKVIDEALRSGSTVEICDSETLSAPGSIGDVLLTKSANEDGLLMYTSGTTGRPKGVVLTHTNLIAGGANTALAHQLSSADSAMCVLPLYHINGLCVTVMGALVSGGGLVVPPKFSVTGFWPAIRDHQCTWFSVVPTQISYLLHQNPELKFDAVPSLRFGRSASAPLSPDIQRAFEDRFGVPIIETMGLTETAAQILSNPLPPATRKIGSPGIAYGNEVIIGDENQMVLPAGTEGEILVRGPNVMRCYLKNEDATSEAVTPEGWLRTGDLGKMDAEGYLYVTGRLKELIIKGGENIAPREVDEALYSHPDVIEAGAFSQPCPQYGERVEAAVMLCEGSQLTGEALIALCVERIGKFKSPDQVYILPELPKGPSGKIQRIKIAGLIR